MYEILTVAAAVDGDRRAAYQALLAHPLGPPADRVQAVLDDLLETNRAHLPRFWAALGATASATGAVMRYFLGVDIGGSKSHALVADEEGRAIGFGEGGPGNWEVVGWDGLAATLGTITDQALTAAGIGKKQIAAAGYGIAGYDWPSESEPTRQAIESLGLDGPYAVVNDTVVGLLAGASEGWGVAVVAGTSNNCRGRDRQGREGRVTGCGTWFGEGGGAAEMMARAVQMVAMEWTRRGPATRLSQAFVELVGAADLADLLEGLVMERYKLSARLRRSFSR